MMILLINFIFETISLKSNVVFVEVKVEDFKLQLPQIY